MSGKGPFDAALLWLNVKGASRMVDSDGSPLEPGWADAAIRVLEAAGKVDKARAIRVLATLLQRYVMGMETITIPELENDLKAGAVKEIRVLLEALPEKEEGERFVSPTKEERRKEAEVYLRNMDDLGPSEED